MRRSMPLSLYIYLVLFMEREMRFVLMQIKERKDAIIVKKLSLYSAEFAKVDSRTNKGFAKNVEKIVEMKSGSKLYNYVKKKITHKKFESSHMIFWID